MQLNIFVRQFEVPDNLCHDYLMQGSISAEQLLAFVKL